MLESAIQPTFSVVMPAFNAEVTVGSAIRSVLAQTRTDFELLVVDDGSTDATVEEIRTQATDPRVRLLRQEHRGVAAARNHAVSEARGTLISMLDSDDLWLPSYLDVMADVLAANPAAALAYTDAWVFDEAKGRFKRATAMAFVSPPSPPPDDPVALLFQLLQNNFVYTSVTVRREVLVEVGPFNTDLPAASDYEMWLRLVARGHRMVRAPGLLAVYRERPGSITSDHRRQIACSRDVYRMMSEDPSFPREMTPVARARMQDCEALLQSADQSKSGLFGLRPHLSKLKQGLLRTWLRDPPPELHWAVAEFVDPGVRRATPRDGPPTIAEPQ
jgi:GT2 family glycosyltransferase